MVFKNDIFDKVSTKKGETKAIYQKMSKKVKKHVDLRRKI